MRSFVLMAVAGVATVASFSGASAQQPSNGSLIDCGNPQNALTVYCNNREPAPVIVAPAPGVVIVPDVGSTGSLNGAQPSNGSLIDCGSPQNALTVYCNNRDQFPR